ncbi:MAG: phage tail sheath family protein [Hespellia sp.]|nr:phage tail sheath family protein [Hespellia sp.]
MSGGNFDINVGKVRPGVYVNTKSKKQQKPKSSTRGIAVVPLIGYNWGPNGKFVKLSVESPDAESAKLGHSIYDADDFMLLIREAFKNAITVYAYVINPGTAAKATLEGMTVTAAYGGTRGNDIKVSSVANVTAGYDVTVYLGTEKVESYKGLETVADLIAASKKTYVTFSAEETGASLTAFAATSLTGGAAGTVETSEVTTFLDKLEGIKWHTLCFPVTEAALVTACITKIKSLRANVGKWVQAVLPDCKSDHEGIISVTNALVLDDGTIEGQELTIAQTCAWVAGVTAAATKTESNTYVEYEGAIGIVGEKTNEEATLAIQNGEFFFSMSDEGKVVVEYDINSLHTFTTEKTSDYRKNRVMRVYDSFAEDLALTFPPNKYDNSEEGWLVMEGLGRSLLQAYLDDGAITNVDLDNDFYVDQSRSQGDETYFNIGIQAVDSAEKLYFSVSTR